MAGEDKGDTKSTQGNRQGDSVDKHIRNSAGVRRIGYNYSETADFVNVAIKVERVKSEIERAVANRKISEEDADNCIKRLRALRSHCNEELAEINRAATGRRQQNRARTHQRRNQNNGKSKNIAGSGDGASASSGTTAKTTKKKTTKKKAGGAKEQAKQTTSPGRKAVQDTSEGVALGAEES